MSSVQKFLFCWIVIFDVLLSTGFAVYGEQFNRSHVIIIKYLIFSGLLLLRQISQLLSSRQRTVLMFRIGAITGESPIDYLWSSFRLFVLLVIYPTLTTSVSVLGLCGLIFLVRSGITVWAVFFSATYIKLWWFDGFYYWAFELLPLSLMLVILRGGDVRRRSNAMQYQPETEPILPNNKSHANYSASYHSDTSAVSPIKSNIYYPDANWFQSSYFWDRNVILPCKYIYTHVCAVFLGQAMNQRKNLVRNRSGNATWLEHQHLPAPADGEANLAGDGRISAVSLPKTSATALPVTWYFCGFESQEVKQYLACFRIVVLSCG